MSRLTSAIILILLTAAAAVFLVMPQWRRIGEERAAVAEFQAFHEELAGLAANRDALIAEYNTVAEADLVKLKGMAPADARTTGVLTSFEELARRNSLALGQVDFIGEKAPTAAIAAPTARRYGAIPVTLTLRGGYENFRDFLSALEHDLRIFDTNEITFAAAQAKQATINLKGQIYFRR